MLGEQLHYGDTAGVSRRSRTGAATWRAGTQDQETLAFLAYCVGLSEDANPQGDARSSSEVPGGTGAVALPAPVAFAAPTLATEALGLAGPPGGGRPGRAARRRRCRATPRRGPSPREGKVGHQRPRLLGGLSSQRDVSVRADQRHAGQTLVGEILFG